MSLQIDIPPATSAWKAEPQYVCYMGSFNVGQSVTHDLMRLKLSKVESAGSCKYKVWYLKKNFESFFFELVSHTQYFSML